MSSRARKQQQVFGAHGQHFVSPKKARTSTTKTAQIFLTQPGEGNELRAKLLNLLSRQPAPETVEVDAHGSEWMDVDADENQVPEDTPEDTPKDSMQDQNTNTPSHATNETLKIKRRILPNTAAYHLYSKWQMIVPGLVDEYLRYLNATIGKPIVTGHWDEISSCACQPIAQQLVKHGLFPAAPEQPRIAVALELLGFYRALFERSCDAVNALAESLHSHYARRGFHVVDRKGEYVDDPWRRSLGAAIQWHDTLQIEVQKRLDTALEEEAASLKASRASVVEPATAESDGVGPSNGEASRLLQARCPACFASRKWGRSFNEGGDFHMSIDGNHHHRHQTSSGDGPHFYDPRYFLSKDEVDAVGDKIEAARKRPARKYKPKVPEEAINECQDSHTAANANKQKADMGHFDDTGVAALVCRHGIPIFFANIDTPGEQQKYAIALILRIYRELPPQATGAFLYDIGCVLDVSINKYDILPEDIMQRTMFATMAMHAYAHQWSCQLMYNPRLKPGLGLSDGEGVERLWSRMRRLIGVTRNAGRRRRIWILDRQLTFIGLDMRDELGDWIRRKLKSGVIAMTTESEKTLATCGATDAELREQWDLQVEAQISVRAHAPKRLQKEIDAVLTLQDDVTAVEKVIDDARSTLSHADGGVACSTKASLRDLRHHHQQLLAGVEKLYASLNIHEKFPELKGVDVEFVRTLLLARDLKINIRKRAVGSFLEWERLDQAVGGKHQALGTKAHQRTRQAITRRKPALLRAIHTFNRYCATLADLHDPSWAIPIPQPMPTNLAALRDRLDLMEDVWISRREEDLPRWLADSNVRDGIRAMLKKDSCLWERRRLGREADNLCRWLGRELTTVELAIRNPRYCLLNSLLVEHRRRLLFLETRWSTPLASGVRFQTAVQEAARTAMTMRGEDSGTSLDWMVPATPSTIITVDDVEDTVDVPSASAPSSGKYQLDSDILIAEDELEDGDDQVNGDSDEILVEKASAVLLWAVPNGISIDPTNDYSLAADELVPIPLLRNFRYRKVVPLPPRRFDVSMERDTFQQFLSPTALLNDNSLNGAAILLQTQILKSNINSTASVAILSTHDLVRIHYGSPDDQLWRGAKATQYWDKNVWILPIHRPTACHWVLCVIYLDTKQLRLFDSFGEECPWYTDIKQLPDNNDSCRSSELYSTQEWPPLLTIRLRGMGGTTNQHESGSKQRI
ncbi:hypothetical protein HWV62_6913 [Athelia sp. TMB]|nr:hypothetical protein HWV62_6913 [Athelia sp. TMB]